MEEFQRFIDDNNIKNPAEFKKQFSGLWCKAQKLKILKTIKYPNKLNNWDNINTLEEFQRFIDDNNITSKTKFQKEFGGAYNKSTRLNILNKLYFIETENYYKWKNYEVSDIQNIINLENLSYTEFSKKYSGLMDKIKTKKLKKFLVFPLKGHSWYEYNINTLEEFQRFIDDNNIKNPRDFSKRFSGLYSRLSKKQFCKKIKYTVDNKFGSSWENELILYLKNNICDLIFKEQKTYPDLIGSSNKPLRFDFLLEYNQKQILLEIQGPHHFYPINYKRIKNSSEYFKLVRKYDIKKNRFARKNNISLLYFTYEPKLLKYGYPYYIFSSEKLILNEIKKIIKYNITMATVQTRTIKGQLSIIGNSLAQDQILLYTTDGKTVSQTDGMVTLIQDIWEELKNPAGTCKTNKKGYWYWEFDVTDTETEKDIKIKFECPRPEPEVFWDETKKDFDFKEGKNDSDWTKYWKTIMRRSEESKYNSTNGLQSKEIIFPGSKYIDQEGNEVEIPETTITRSDLGDISNLLDVIY